MNELIDLASERAILAGVIHYGEDLYLDVASIIQARTFSDPSNMAIWECIQYLYDDQGVKVFDHSAISSAATQLGHHHLNERPEEIRHIAGILQTRVREENVLKHAGTVRRLQIARLLREQLQQADVDVANLTGKESIEQILGIAEGAVFDFSSLMMGEGSNEPKLINTGLDNYIANLEANPDKGIGISSGWGLYDHAIGGGFRRGTISLVGARPKVGKSILAVNVAMHVAGVSNIPVLYIDTEMRDEDHWPRCLANLTYQAARERGVTIDDIERVRYIKTEKKNRLVREAQKVLNSIPVYYYSAIGMSIEEILPSIRRWIHKVVGKDENGHTKDCLLIYDYIKLQSAEHLSDSLKEYQAIGFLTTALHNFVGRQDVPMLSLIQLSRYGETQESGGIIAQSDRVLWLVTNFTIFKAKADEEVQHVELSTGNRKLVPIAARHGEGLQEGDYINMYFRKPFGYIEQGDTRHNLRRLADQQQRDAKDEDDRTLLGEDSGTDGEGM